MTVNPSFSRHATKGTGLSDTAKSPPEYEYIRRPSLIEFIPFDSSGNNILETIASEYLTFEIGQRAKMQLYTIDKTTVCLHSPVLKRINVKHKGFIHGHLRMKTIERSIFSYYCAWLRTERLDFGLERYVARAGDRCIELKIDKSFIPRMCEIIQEQELIGLLALALDLEMTRLHNEIITALENSWRWIDRNIIPRHPVFDTLVHIRKNTGFDGHLGMLVVDIYTHFICFHLQGKMPVELGELLEFRENIQKRMVEMAALELGKIGVTPKGLCSRNYRLEDNHDDSGLFGPLVFEDLDVKDEVWDLDSYGQEGYDDGQTEMVSYPMISHEEGLQILELAYEEGKTEYRTSSKRRWHSISGAIQVKSNSKER